jgi:hypothetical protein
MNLGLCILYSKPAQLTLPSGEITLRGGEMVDLDGWTWRRDRNQHRTSEMKPHVRSRFPLDWQRLHPIPKSQEPRAIIAPKEKGQQRASGSRGFKVPAPQRMGIIQPAEPGRERCESTVSTASHVQSRALHLTPSIHRRNREDKSYRRPRVSGEWERFRC